MRGRIFVVGLLLILSASGSWSPAAQPLPIPASWLAVAYAKNIESAREFGTKLVGEVGSNQAKLTHFISMVASVLKPEAFGDGAFLFGVAEGSEAWPPFFAVCRPPSLDHLVEAYDGERVGASGVIEVLGVPIVLTPIGDAVLMVLGESAEASPDLTKAPVFLPVDQGTVGFSVSQRGLERMAESYSKRPAQDVRAARRQLRAANWSAPQLATFSSVLTTSGPLWRELSARSKGFRFYVDRLALDELQVVVQLDLQQARESDFASLAVPPVKNDQTTRLVAANPGPLLQDLLALSLAYVESQPGLIEANQYDATAFSAYSDQLSAVASLVARAEAIRMVPDEDQPVGAIGMMVLDVSQADVFMQQVHQLTQTWNRLVNKSNGKTRLLFDARDFASDDLRGVEFRCDLLTAFGIKQEPAMRKLMDRHVGNDGWQTFRVIRLPGERILVADAPLSQVLKRLGPPPEYNLPPAESAAATEGANQIAALSWSLDRYLAWLAAVRAIDGHRVIGAKQLVPMKPSPAVRVQLDGAEQRVQLTIRIEPQTLRAYGAYCRQNQ